MAMNHTRVENLKSGAVLARDIKDRSGRVLVPAGTTLGDKHIRVLKAWGVTEVEIKGEPEKGDESLALAAQENPQVFKETEDHMKQLFLHADLRHPMLRELYDVCFRRRLNEKMKK